MTNNLDSKHPTTCYPTQDALVTVLEQEHGKAIAKWAYVNAEGEPVGAKVAFAQTGHKSLELPLRRAKNGWEVGAMPTPRPLYNLTHFDDKDYLYIVSSERDVDLMGEIGLNAVTCFNGADGVEEADWAALRPKVAMIAGGLGDVAFIETVRDSLSRSSYAMKIKIVGITGLQDSEGIGDFIKNRRATGDTDITIRQMIEGMADHAQAIELDGIPQKRANIVRLSDIQPEPVCWLWPGRIAIGKLTMLAGDPGLGKSFVTLDIAARISTGRGWPDTSNTQCDPSGVVLLNAEDDLSDTIRPRLDAAGADAKRIVALQSVTNTDAQTGEVIDTTFSLATDLTAIVDAMTQVLNCRLVIIDPITAYLGETDSHKNADVRGLLAPLSDLAARHHIAVLAVTHLNKNNSGPAIYRTMGSLAFTAASRAVWGISKDKDDPQRRLMLPVKNNLSLDTGGLAYTLETNGTDSMPHIVWDPEPVLMTADEAMACERDNNERSDRDQAGSWLRDALAEGPMSSREIFAQAKENGISEKTLRRAFADLGGKPFKASFGSGWFWRLPTQDGQLMPEVTQDGHVLGVGILGKGGHLGNTDTNNPMEGVSG